MVDASWVEDRIREICDGPENALGGGFVERAWGTPLVGFSSGDDPIFEQYKEVVDPEHWTPVEAFARVYPEAQVRSDELTVISWVLPQTEATKADNRRESFTPAERWARSRIFGEAFNNTLRDRVVATLGKAGVAAVAPMRAPGWKSISSERYVFASVWSERHAAYASGLGTFGVCDGLITPVGKAMRVGSVVARVRIPPTPRPYADHQAYCLFYSQGICGACITRCPVGALSEAGHDKLKCRAHLGDTTKPYVQSEYGFDGYGCGLCQTGVPCESKIPTAADL